MGFNTVALFLNDQCGEIERRGPEVISELSRCMASGIGTGQFGGIGQTQVLPSIHADGQQVVVAGGNRITLLGIVYGLSHEPEDVLRQLVEQHGFRLVKKGARR